MNKKTSALLRGAPFDRPRLIARRPLHEVLVEEMRDLLSSGRLTPGEPIIEATLCGEFGVSRTPLREALKVLASEGLVLLRPNRTPLVAPVEIDEVAAAFDILEGLEALAAKRLCERLDASSLNNLEALHAKLLDRHAADDREGYGETNREFHVCVVALSANPILPSLCGPLNARILRARRTTNFNPTRWRESVQEHEDLMSAFRVRDRNAAADRMALHIRRTGAAVVAMLNQAKVAQKAGSSRQRVQRSLVR